MLKSEIEDVPYFNAPIFLENKSQIGKIDEIFGTLRDYSVSVKLGENMQASSFIPKQKLFIDPAKLLPLNRFLPQPPKPKGIGKKKKGEKGAAGNGGGDRGGFGMKRLSFCNSELACKYLYTICVYLHARTCLQSVQVPNLGLMPCIY